MSLRGAFIVILLLAMGAGLLFNHFMPQGIGFLPPETADPLWAPASVRVGLTLHGQGALFVDARDPGSYKQAHIRGAVNLNSQEWDMLYPLLKEQIMAAGQVVVYGRSRSRFPAAGVAQRLRRQGVERVWVVQGSLEDWERAGGPVRRSRRRTGE